MKILLLYLQAFETMAFSPFIDVMGWARDDFSCEVEIEICRFTPKNKKHIRSDGYRSYPAGLSGLKGIATFDYLAWRI